ncbi:MAG: methyl-accepting chemotaxis protein [Microcystaceae cyanobacterium]
MSILNSQKLQTRMLLGYSAPLGLLVLFAILMGWGIIQQNSVSKERARANQMMFALDEADIGMSRMVRNARGAVLFPNEPHYRESFDKGRDIYEQGKLKVEEKIRDDKQKANWQEFMQEGERLDKAGMQVISLIKQGKVAEAKNIAANMPMTDLSAAYSKMAERQEEILDEIRKDYGFATTLSWILIFVGLIGGTVGTLVLGAMISKGIAGEVKKNVTDITTSSNEITTSAEQQAATSNEQAAAVNETTTTMDELGASSRQSEEQAESASTAAQEVLQLAENGNNAVEDTVSSMMELKNKVLDIANQTMRLSEQTTQIGNISDLVSDLAQQTNMLALNASVEAVRAGEHGKGFSVVAEEIRKLADQSKQSAEKINALVIDIQNAINTTVMVTDEGTKTVNAGMQVTERTAQAFAGVAEAINNVVMNNQQITLNIRQQSRAVQQVLASMEQINQGAQQNAAGIQQITSGTKQINDKARNLEAMV